MSETEHGHTCVLSVDCYRTCPQGEPLCSGTICLHSWIIWADFVYCRAGLSCHHLSIPTGSGLPPRRSSLFPPLSPLWLRPGCATCCVTSRIGLFSASGAAPKTPWPQYRKSCLSAAISPSSENFSGSSSHSTKTWAPLLACLQCQGPWGGLSSLFLLQIILILKEDFSCGLLFFHPTCVLSTFHDVPGPVLAGAVCGSHSLGCLRQTAAAQLNEYRGEDGTRLWDVLPVRGCLRCLSFVGSGLQGRRRSLPGVFQGLRVWGEACLGDKQNWAHSGS
jgi:hypothetical protein